MRDGLNISGLTTAASIWAVSAIGVLIGVGFYAAAIALAFLAYALMMWGSRFEGLFPSRHAVAVTLQYKNSVAASEEDIRSILSGCGYDLAKGSFAISEQNNQIEWRFVVVSIGSKQSASLVRLSRAFGAYKDLDSFTLTHARN